MSQNEDNVSIDDELLTSPKRNAKPESPATEISEAPESRFKLQKIALPIFYIALGFFAFLVFLIPKLPYEVLTENALNFLSLQSPYIWKSEGAKTSFIFGPSVEFTKLTLTSKPFGLGSQSEPKPILLDSLTLAPKIFASLPLPGLKALSPTAYFQIKAFQGEASGNLKMTMNEAKKAPPPAAGTKPAFPTRTSDMGATPSPDIDAAITGSKLNLEKMSAALPLPDIDLKGTVQDLNVNFSIGESKLSRANGAVKIKLKNVQLDPAGFNLGMPLPILSLGDVTLQGTVKNGRMLLDHTQIGDASHDAELLIDGNIELREPVEFSNIDLKMRLKFAPKISQAVPFLDSFLSNGKRPDGYYGLKLAGSIANLNAPVPDPSN